MIETIQGVTILQTIEPTTHPVVLYFITLGFAIIVIVISAIIINVTDDCDIVVLFIILLIFSSLFYGWLVMPKFAETNQSYRCKVEDIDACRELTEHYKVLDEYDGIYLVR